MIVAYVLIVVLFLGCIVLWLRTRSLNVRLSEAIAHIQEQRKLMVEWDKKQNDLIYKLKRKGSI